MMIDIKNLDKLTPAQRAQFNSLLEQFPQLESKMDTSRELNTPTKQEQAPAPQINEEMDYSNFMSPSIQEKPLEINKENLPSLKFEESPSFGSLDREEDKPLTKEEKAAKEERVKQARVKAAVAAGQAPEVASFSPEGKVHPILTKLRATVGLRSVQKPIIVNVGGCNYSMRPLDRGAISNATALAMSTTTNPILYQTTLESALVAYSIVAIDNVPLIDIFSIPITEKVDGKTVSILSLKREEMAAEAFYTEIMKSPNELTETLSTYYQQNFPLLNLFGEGKAKFVCPEADCLQSRIDDQDAVCYCPIHGEKMTREDSLPNPS
jgi:hypothetical protein